MRIGAACSPGSAWQREASTASRERRFALRHPAGIRGYVSLSALPVSKKSRTAATARLGPFVHWLPRASGRRAPLSQMQYSSGPLCLGVGGGLPSGRIVLGWDGKQFGLKNTCLFVCF